MDADRWRRIDALFDSASQMDGRERERFLGRLRAGEPELCTEVESLLAASAVGDSRIDDIVAAQASGALAARRASREQPEIIGSYRVLSVLGEGGLSTVYLAERADDEYRAVVAIKVSRRGLTSGEVERRLVQERQILANVEHPNIARLLDGGTTELGQAYFVMEYIDGETIDSHCDHQRLTLGQRLELFCKVCDAVDHAHRRLVVHRDIKPSNIVVSREGEPKLLDFGIAKLLTSDFSGVEPLETATGLRLMTPEYASPEQVRGLPLTTGSDVYSLGVVLYRLLTGALPYRFESLRPLELDRVINEQSPTAPSLAIGHSPPVLEELAQERSTTPQRLRRDLAGDLDSIALMALRKEPHRRYASAEQLASDIRRHLESLPIRARRDSRSYRVRRFVRRHTAAVGLAGALLLALLGGMVATTVAGLRARENLAESEQVSRFLVELFEAPDPSHSRGDEPTARELLDRGSRRIDLELEHQPALRQRLMVTMGRAYGSLGEHVRAREILEQVLARRQRQLGSHDPLVAVSLRDVARVMMAQGDRAGALERLTEALEIHRQREPRSLETAATLYLLAGMTQHEGDGARAAVLHEEALALRRKLLPPVHPLVLESLHGRSEALYAQGDLEQAESFSRLALAGRRRVLGNDHPDVALTLNNLAVVLYAKGEFEGATEVIEEVVEIRRRLYGEEHWLMAQSYGNLAGVLVAGGRASEATGYYQRALDLSRALLGEEHPYVASFTRGLDRARKAAAGEELQRPATGSRGR